MMVPKTETRTCFGTLNKVAKNFPEDWVTNHCIYCHRTFIEVYEQAICNKCNEINEAINKEKVTRAMIVEIINDLRALYKENAELRKEISEQREEILDLRWQIKGS